MLERLGIRGRLLLTFVGISALAVLTTAAAMHAFREVDEVMERIAEERAPTALASLRLSRQAERVAAAAATVLTAANAAEHKETSAAVAQDMAQLERLLSELKGTSQGAGALEEIEATVERLGQNLDELNALVSARLAVAARKEELLRHLTATTIASQRLLAAGILVLDAKVPQWRAAAADPTMSSQARAQANEELAQAVVAYVPQQKAQQEIAALNEALLKAAAMPTRDDLGLVAFPIRRSLELLVSLAESVDDQIRSRFRQRIAELEALAIGTDGIPRARESELELLEKGAALVSENKRLSALLTGAVDRLVDASTRDIAEAGRDATAVQRYGSGIVIGSALLTLLTSALVVWLYVDRNLLARLAEVSRGMLSIAGGDLRVRLPASGPDEIGRMAAALQLFRDTAVEVEEKNLRDVAEARQRLVDAIESISEGFALYDADDKLLLCNSRYREILYPGIADAIVPGASFESIIRTAVDAGLIEDAKGREEDWIARRLESHRKPAVTLIQHRSPDRWIQVSERRIGGGGTVAVYSDITEPKRREEMLAEKSATLEALSTKLSKYLAPQVYNSIFAGRQDVRIVTQRKKLTICFSDLTGFTELADRMESEELTQLLNHYLTEMSRIATEYGATIDKYVGDAILMFFGDPESRGVREDAQACVAMAIAMQSRMAELALVWRDAGIETPLRCRIGIHTDYCTVGNFGSEDRMDYTIIGGAVNVASRLEQEAPAGAILVSYETFAQVRESVVCEDMGQLRLKGIAYPVAAFRVIEFKSSSDVRDSMRAELPHLKFEAQPAMMSAEERQEAAAALRRLLDRITPSRPEAERA